jgi:hypothetical protein
LGVKTASIVVGFLLMIPLAALFDAADWPVFHTWGLVHGSFLIAWPVLAGLSFAVGRGLKETKAELDAVKRPE